MMQTVRLPVVVLISGQGTNLQAMLDAAARGELPVEFRAVVSDRASAPGLDRARRAGIAAEVVAPATGESREHYDERLVETVERYAPRLVALAGFMRVLGPAAVRTYEGRMLNIHPSLLPAYRGLHTHRRVLADGVREHGASVHFVTEELDGGPVVVQARVPVLPGDDEQTLAARVREREHVIYPLAMRWFAEGRLVLRDGAAWLDGRRLQAPIQWRGQ
ncbi:MAG TPA: phosphoribosylglycinamide formyltransferase [Gammaproteobacteria bacterium]|nr:phosphoribosylglycinamide formyltransferase [Gammaproteobacteria bacterium]